MSQRCFPVSARLLRGQDEDDEEEVEEKAEQALSSMLSEMELTPLRHQTAHDRIIRKIISSCRGSDSVSIAGTVQLITLQILVCTILSSELIERVTLEEGEGEGEEDRCCSICLEKLLIGKSAMRMACGHIYHTPCILRWLQASNFCPLCRFRCPFFDS